MGSWLLNPFTLFGITFQARMVIAIVILLIPRKMSLGSVWEAPANDCRALPPLLLLRAMYDAQEER